MAKTIPLRGKHGIGLFTIVDDDDYEYLNQFKWHVTNGYVQRTNKKIHISMHREIMNHPKNMMVDHINRNPLDNRKENLRICVAKENTKNSSKKKTTNPNSQYKGVCFSKGSWYAYVGCNYDCINGGAFPTEELAAKRYDQLARELHKDFAALNFPNNSDYTDVENHIKKKVAKKKSKFRGVTKSGKKWLVNITIGQITYILTCTILNEEEAARIYDFAAMELTKFRANKPILNFPLETPKCSDVSILSKIEEIKHTLQKI